MPAPVSSPGRANSASLHHSPSATLLSSVCISSPLFQRSAWHITLVDVLLAEFTGPSYNSSIPATLVLSDPLPIIRLPSLFFQLLLSAAALRASLCPAQAVPINSSPAATIINFYHKELESTFSAITAGCRKSYVSFGATIIVLGLTRLANLSWHQNRDISIASQMPISYIFKVCACVYFDPIK